MLPEDGRRPKHVGAFKYFNVCFLNTESISAFVGFFFQNILDNFYRCTVHSEIHNCSLTNKCTIY
jgi:hypothetical protein